LKLIVIGDRREYLLDALEIILKHWGYRVLASSNPKRLEAILNGIKADLLILGSDLPARQISCLPDGPQKTADPKTFPLILLSDLKNPHREEAMENALPVPIDIFSLFQLVQRHLEKIPRRDIRLAVQLPAILFTDGEFRFGEVLSLSVRGMFLKNSSRLKKGERIRILFPLTGMKKEMEVEGKVRYHILPNAGNNFLEGIGVEFFGLAEQDHLFLETFIEKSFLGELRGGISPESGLPPGEPLPIDFKLKKTA